ncbi:MAG: hypothetical protein AVO33_10385 [delta proteobacterium ML8_F1]|nr:MAG: hypothetical protein AVO33_10385 [delta proteobacterium ML8_F1]
MMDKKIDLGNLFAFYGGILTRHQQQILKAYLYEDHSLKEISENHKISRQGVHDSIRRSEAILMDLEDKLGLYALQEALVKLKMTFESFKKDPSQEEGLALMEQQLLAMEKILES